MSEFGVQPEVNLGGVTRVQYVMVEEVERCPELMGTDLAVALEEIVLVEGADWKDYPLTVDGAQYSGTPNEGPNGEVLEHRLWGEIGGDDETRAAAYSGNRYQKFVLLLTDGNGNTRLMGTPRSPARLGSSHKTGDVHGENVRSWQFYMRGSDPLPFVE